MKLIVRFLLCIFLIKVIRAVVLEDVTVPSYVLIDDDEQEDIVLDCVYRIESNDSGPLVVKWYKDNKAAYQWIRGHLPNVLPNFRGEIDGSFEVSEDPNYKYRGLALENISVNDTGVYKCVVQTLSATHVMEKYLQVINVRNHTLNLYHHKMDNETHLECTVENVYPKPTIYIITEDDDIIPIITTKLNENDLGLYTATSIATVNNEEEDDDETYKCIVSFGDLPWNLTISTSDSPSQTHRAFSKTFLLFLILPIVLFL